ncbi:histamine H1 receptor-like [Rhopilema esculentum]|uniref:histamine H1 receptor-like n=1 Tax=Rhopilema esculentum TaxID=499914 RepID=UPI0031DBCF09|eukprot:gene6752-12318_t
MNTTLEEHCLALIQIGPQPSVAVRISIYFTSIINGLSMLTAVLGNLMILFILWKFERLHFPSTVLVASLCLCDLIIGLIVQPLSILIRVLEMKYHSNCQMKTAYRYFGIFAVGLSVVSIAMVSVDRCLAVTFPFRYQKFARNSRYGKIVAIVWVTWGLLSVMPLIKGIPITISYQLLFGLVVGFFIMIILSYFKIIRVMYRQRRRIAAAALITRSIQSFDFNQNQDDSGVFLGATTTRRMRRYSINIDNSQANRHSEGPQNRVAARSLKFLAVPPLIVAESESTNPKTLNSTTNIMSRGSIHSLIDSTNLLTLPSTTDIEYRRSLNSLTDSTNLLTLPSTPDIESRASINSLIDSTNRLTLPSTTAIESRGSINSLLDSDGDFKMRRKRAQSIFRSTRDFAADVVKRSVRRPSQRSGTSTVVIVVTLLLICYLPKSILFLISGRFQYAGDDVYIADTLSDMFMFLNSALNPFIYSFRSKNIKDCIYQLIKRKQDSWELDE